jgi:hypothetical protein
VKRDGTPELSFPVEIVGLVKQGGYGVDSETNPNDSRMLTAISHSTEDVDSEGPIITFHCVKRAY